MMSDDEVEALLRLIADTIDAARQAFEAAGIEILRELEAIRHAVERERG